MPSALRRSTRSCAPRRRADAAWFLTAALTGLRRRHQGFRDRRRVETAAGYELATGLARVHATAGVDGTPPRSPPRRRAGAGRWCPRRSAPCSEVPPHPTLEAVVRDEEPVARVDGQHRRGHHADQSARERRQRADGDQQTASELGRAGRDGVEPAGSQADLLEDPAGPGDAADAEQLWRAVGGEPGPTTRRSSRSARVQASTLTAPCGRSLGPKAGRAGPWISSSGQARS
jgi:hypothetical protein